MKPAELGALDFIAAHDYTEVRHLLLEGVDPDAQHNGLLQAALHCGDSGIFNLLLKFGATIGGNEPELLGEALTLAAPTVLQTLLEHLDDSQVHAALTQDEHALLVVAGDICAQADRNLKNRVKLTDVRVKRLPYDQLGDAVRYAVFELRMPKGLVWNGIARGARENARFLARRFKPSGPCDAEALAQWLGPCLD